MIDKIKQFFSANLHPGAESDALGQPQAIQLAAAALMIEVSRADFVLNEAERQTVVGALRSQFGLDRETVNDLVTLAEQEVEESVSLYQFTQLVNEHYSDAQKCALIGSMWQVAYADGHLDIYEDHLIRKVAELIYVPHSEFIRLKLEAAW